MSSRRIIFYNSEQDKQNRDSNLILDLRWYSGASNNLAKYLKIYFQPTAKCFTFDLLRKAMSFAPMPKKFQESFSFSTLEKAKLDDLTSRILTCRWRTRTTWDRDSRYSKAMSSFRSAITCQRRVKCVRNLCGTCSDLQQRMNVKGKLDYHLSDLRWTSSTWFNLRVAASIKIVLRLMKIFPRCRIKVHKDHIDNNDPLAPCKLHHDPNSARDMLLLATSPEDQNKWVSRLSKRIQKSGYKANSTSNNLNSTMSSGDGTKISPR